MPGCQSAAARSFEHRRGYGSLYAALSHGRLDVERLRDLLVSVPLPRFEGRIVLSVDVSPWLRSDTACSPERLFYHVHGRWTVSLSRGFWHRHGSCSS
ncbi:transposase [Streptomyces mirabilis]|uniref:transposase n=1 Tax=Streptomyces mirabilis TaxID=68239 RepID=UPI00371A7766